MTDLCKTTAAPWHKGQDRSVFEPGSSKSLCSFFCSVCDVSCCCYNRMVSQRCELMSVSAKCKLATNMPSSYAVPSPWAVQKAKDLLCLFLRSWCWLGSSWHVGLGAGYVSGTPLGWLEGQLVSGPPSWTTSRVPEGGSVTASISRDPDVDIPAPATL